MDYGVLYFTVESPDECFDIANAFINGLPPQDKFTFGSYFKGVE
jgi:hypothetical protein